MADSAPTAPTSSANASATYTTPTKRPAFTSVNADAGPSRARPSGASPAYSSRKHSLYGVEDRVIIDPGSRVWKVGYSGEYDPRAVLWASDWMDTHEESGKGVWELDLADTARANGDMAEAGRLVAGRILQLARDTYIRHLKTDSKTRKVIILENTFLPDFVKQSLAKAFFENLQVPSVAFTSTPVLALAACGRATGLVVDVGWLETIITPVYHSRPMYHMARSTPLAGQALHRRLRALLLDRATYIPPSSSWSATPPHAGSVPVAILTDRLIERIITEACFASDPISEPYVPVAMSGDQDGVSAAARNKVECEALQARYEAHCDATDVQFELRTPEGVGRLSVPGWMRERAVEVLFGDDGSEAVPLQDVILQVVSKLAVDLRAPMLSSILVTGGTASLPGFTPRLRDTLLQSLSASAQPPTSLDAGTQPSPPKVHRITSPEYRAAETAAWRRRHERPYAVLAPLRGKLAILNDPCPLDVLESENEREGALGAGSGSTSKGQGRSAGRAPRWTPGLMPWVGASLAGALKTGGPAITREEYDTRSALNAEKSVAYNKALEAEWQREIEAATTAESLATEPQGASAVAKPPSGRVFEGVQLEDLLPGMALMGGQSRRKRGWRSEVGVQDWARVLRT